MANLSREARTVAAALTFCLGFATAGCQDTDKSSDETGQGSRIHTEAIAENNEPLSVAAPYIELPQDLLLLYNKLNMRSFPSSFGPRLKHYCESYLFEYFPRDSVHVDSPRRMTLVNGDDTWIVESLASDKIRVSNTISGPASYNSTDEYDVLLVAESNDIRSNAHWIEQKTDCTPLNPGKNTALGLTDHRISGSESGWVCGDFWSGSAVTPEYEHWKSLGDLPREQRPNQPSWGPADMLLISIKDYAGMNKKCSSNGQMRRVKKTPIYSRENGEETGSFTRIETYAHGMLEMTGFITSNIGDEQKADFDLIAKEQTVLLITESNGDWINITKSNRQGAWIKTGTFDAAIYTTKILPYTDRLLSADEINFMDSTAHRVHREASVDAEVLHTLRDARTAMTPLELKGEWLKVKFVPPPDYPLIGCGDDAADFEWIQGWVKWRKGADWFITEEHHYGC